jgi:hypothetical protein
MALQTHRLRLAAPTRNLQDKRLDNDRNKDPDKPPAGADFAAGNSPAELPAAKAHPAPAKMARHRREGPLPQVLQAAKGKVLPDDAALSSRCPSTIRPMSRAKGTKPGSRRKAERPTIRARSDKLPRLMQSL